MPALYENRVGLSLSIAIAVLFALFDQPCDAQQIDALVDEVSVANIEAHIEALAVGIGPRDTDATRAEAADYIAGQLEGFGYAVTRAPVLSSENVIAQLTGAVDPAKTVVIGAHFDSFTGSPGADDNASGVAGFLEIARVLRNTRPAYSIDFVGFALEEAPGGPMGSTTYASDAAAQGRDLLGVLNLEMIAYTSTQDGTQFAFSDIPECMAFSEQGLTVGDYIAAVGNDDSASLLNTFQRAAAQYVPELHALTANVAGNGDCFSRSRDSDHGPFWDQGYRALMITDTANFRNPNYHQPSDTLDTLDFEFARNVTQATLATALASMPVPGDFNADRVLSAEDIDLLLAEFRAKDPLRSFDINGDGIVDDDDLEFWISDLKQTYFGDADLDGKVDAADLNNLALSWQVNDATSWAQGDFDGDGNVDATDLNSLALNWRKGTAEAASVPEPSTPTLLLIVGILTITRLRSLR